MRDGRTIAVGNGGVATHPDYDRIKLNLATMSRRWSISTWRPAT